MNKNYINQTLNAENEKKTNNYPLMQIMIENYNLNAEFSKVTFLYRKLQKNTF